MQLLQVGPQAFPMGLLCAAQMIWALKWQVINVNSCRSKAVRSTHLMACHMLQLQELLIGSPKLDILIHELIHAHCQSLTLSLLPEA